MQLTLLIEIKRVNGIPPHASLMLNDRIVEKSIIEEHNEVTINVTDTDIVSIVMQDKGLNDTEIHNHQIISDKAVVLTGVCLEGMHYNDLNKLITYFDTQHNLLEPDTYMHKNGKINISIKQLIQTVPNNLNVLTNLTIEQMYSEVLEQTIFTKMMKFCRSVLVR